MRFTVIVATLGRPQILARTLRSVAACDPAPTELIVVDGDPGRTSEVATQGEWPFPIRYMTSAPGLPKQRNAGIDRAAGDVLVFLDDDVEIPGDTFSTLDRVYADQGVVGATARIVEPATDRIGKKHSPVRRFLPGGGEEGHFTRFGYPRRLIDLETERDIDFMHGSFMSVRAEIAKEVRFDERLPGYALAEDEDFSYRVSRRGRIRFVPALQVIHAKEGHGSRDARAFGRTVVINRSYLFRKNFKPSVMARMQFVLLIGMFMGHRLVNGEFSELAGLVEGSFKALGRPLERPVAESRSGVPRVAFVSSHARSGGSEKYLVTLVDLLEPEMVGPIVSLEEGPLVDELRTGGREVLVIHSSGRALSVGRAALSLRKALRTANVDVVHANGIKAALTAVLARTKVPIVWVKHDFSFDKRLAPFVAKRVTQVVGVSDAALQVLGPDQRASARVIHNGIRLPSVDRDEARAKLLAELGADEGDLLVGLVGRMHPVKGHLDLIAAAQRVLVQRPNLRVVFVGGEDEAVPYHAERVRSEAAVLGGRAHFLGHRDGVHQLVAGMDVAVMTSNREGRANVEAFPLTALEVLACGTPLVGYRSGGIPELVGDCARLVPTGDVRGLAAALLELVDDESARARLSECGPERVSTEFSLDRMVAEMSDLYEDLDRSAVTS